MDLTCIKCGEVAAIRLDLTDGDTMTCPDCDGEFTVGDIEALIDQWGAVLPWLRSHPARTATPDAEPVAATP